MESLLKIQTETGETPHALKNRPVPTSSSIEFWQAFQDTSGSRTWSQGGPSEIPYLAKIAWLDENLYFDIDDRADVLFVLKQLDSFYIKSITDKM